MSTVPSSTAASVGKETKITVGPAFILMYGLLVIALVAVAAMAIHLSNSRRSAQAVCKEVVDLIDAAGPRVMYPVDASPDEQLRFILETKKRELDPRDLPPRSFSMRISLRFVDSLKEEVVPKNSELSRAIW